MVTNHCLSRPVTLPTASTGETAAPEIRSGPWDPAYPR